MTTPTSTSTSIKNIADRADDVNSHFPRLHAGYSVLPNVFSGGSLFSATFEKTKETNSQVKHGDRKYQIYYSGDSLQQSDLNIYLRIISYMEKSHYKIGDNFWLHLHIFLADYCKTKVPTKSYDLVEQALWRLYTSEVTIIRPNLPPFFCRLISARSLIFNGNGNRKIIEISIDPNFRKAFTIDGYSFIDMRERGDLGSNQLALWLHLYYARHVRPFPITTRYVYENSKSSCKDFSRWVRDTLSGAVEKINKLEGWRLFLDKANRYEEAKLFCEQKPTLSRKKAVDKRPEPYVVRK